MVAYMYRASVYVVNLSQINSPVDKLSDNIIVTDIHETTNAPPHTLEAVDTLRIRSRVSCYR